MLILSFKVPFKRVAAIAAAVTLIILVVIYTAILRPGVGRTPGGGSEEQREAFLTSYGWEIDPAGSYVVEVSIPASFDSVFEAYNEIQLSQGYDLWNYAGKRVKRYSYLVSNYPEGNGDIRANLLVYNGKIIGGDVSSMEKGGFSHGFKVKE